MKRGDVILAILPGDYGKARPCIVVQDDRLARLESVILCPCTSDLTGSVRARLLVEPTPGNGLQLQSEIMVEKLAGVTRTRCREVIGALDGPTMRELDARIAFVTGLMG